MGLRINRLLPSLVFLDVQLPDACFWHLCSWTRSLSCRTTSLREPIENAAFNV